MTTLDDLRSFGGIVSDEPVKHPIRFSIGDEEIEAHIFVRQLSIGDQERIFKAADNKDQSRAAAMISELVTLGEDGKQRIPFQDAYKLHPNLAGAMVAAIKQVNRLDAAKN